VKNVLVPAPTSLSPLLLLENLRPGNWAIFHWTRMRVQVLIPSRKFPISFQMEKHHVPPTNSG